ncbi:MAG: glycosyltransferase family 39 protein [Caldilineaceae bacterium]
MMKNRWYLPVIVLLYVLLAGIYSICVPLFEAPDEVWHYGYVYWVAGDNGLPTPDRHDGLAIWAQEGSQPPLYYLMAGLLTRPLTGALTPGDWGGSVRYNPHAAVGEADSFGNRNHLIHGTWDRWPWHGVALGAHAARLFSILLGVVTVAFTYLIGRRLVPSEELPAALAAALVAFNPQFLFLSASVSNDNLITATCAVGVWLCLRIAGSRTHLPLRWPILLGLVVGMAALAKLSGLLLVGLALVALAIGGWRQRSWRSWLGGSALVLLVAATVAGWWYWRNWRLSGDPLGLAGMFAVLPARETPLDATGLLALAPGVWRSAWAVFGWFNVTVDEWVYWAYSLLATVGCAGWIVVTYRHIWGQNGRKVDWVAAGLLAGWSAAVAAALVRWAQINYPQGRLLFPAIAAAMPLIAVGLLAWWPPAWRRWVAGAVGLGMAVLAAAVPFVWIMPAYAAPPLVVASEAAAEVPNPHQDKVGDHVQLIGYSYAKEALLPGGEFDITLYWRSDAPLPEDYSVFVHLVDELGIVQAQSDSYPAQGSRPTSDWQPGTIVADEHRVRLPETLPAPGSLRVEVGMYRYADGQRLPTAQGDSVALGSVNAAALTSPAGIPNPMRAVFGDKIALTGYSLDRRSLRPGDSLQLDLWWEGLVRMTQDYKVFVHLMLPPDAVWAQQDRQPQDGAARTSTWQPGQAVEDQYTLIVPKDAPPGIYDVAVGLYDKDTYDRLQINNDDQPIILARVRVEP